MLRLQVTMQENIVKKIDEYAKKAGLSRSGFLAVAAMDYIDAKEKAPKITESFLAMAKLMDSRTKGEISKEEMEKGLNELENDMKELGK